MSKFAKRKIGHEIVNSAPERHVIRVCADTLYTMFRARAIGLFIALAFFGWASAGAGVRDVANIPATLERIYLTAYDEAINRHASVQHDGTTYVSTGDISAEWLRDASAVSEPYIPLAVGDTEMASTLRGVVARQARYILLDPYANAFSSDYHVVEEKFEVDSLLYPVDFACRYWQVTGDRTIFTHDVQLAFDRVIKVLRDEQHHERRSHYRNPQLANHGEGTPVRETGMIWTGFRPSDDPARYHYNIPENMFAVVTLRRLSQVERDVFHDQKQAQNAWGLAVQVQHGIENNAVVNLPGIGRVYAYEVDGFGHANLMDDANIPRCYRYRISAICRKAIRCIRRREHSCSPIVTRISSKGAWQAESAARILRAVTCGRWLSSCKRTRHRTGLSKSAFWATWRIPIPAIIVCMNPSMQIMRRISPVPILLGRMRSTRNL